MNATVSQCLQTDAKFDWVRFDGFIDKQMISFEHNCSRKIVKKIYRTRYYIYKICRNQFETLTNFFHFRILIVNSQRKKIDIATELDLRST